MKRINLILLLCLSLFMVSCGGDDDPAITPDTPSTPNTEKELYGTWSAYDYNAYVFLVFNHSGNGYGYYVYKKKLYYDFDGEPFTWEIKDNKVYVKRDEKKAEYILQGNKLVYSIEVNPLEFEKVSDSQSLPLSVDDVIYPSRK